MDFILCDFHLWDYIISRNIVVAVVSEGWPAGRACPVRIVRRVTRGQGAATTWAPASPARVAASPPAATPTPGYVRYTSSKTH